MDHGYYFLNKFYLVYGSLFMGFGLIQIGLYIYIYIYIYLDTHTYLSFYLISNRRYTFIVLLRSIINLIECFYIF